MLIMLCLTQTPQNSQLRFDFARSLLHLSPNRWDTSKLIPYTPSASHNNPVIQCLNAPKSHDIPATNAIVKVGVL